MANSFTISEKFNVQPEVLYKAWLNSKEHTNFTGSTAKINPGKGGKFTTWDDYISGETIGLDVNKKIVQSWRTTEFPTKSPNSRVEIVFEKTANGTKLTIKHYDIPDGQAEEYKKGWKEYYFEPMKEYFSKKMKK
jgi:activator of HSP90 ATPase